MLEYVKVYNGGSLSESDVCISFLPLGHVFEQGNFQRALADGYCIGFYSGDPL